jgi:site-specific recombinase XerD
VRNEELVESWLAEVRRLGRSPNTIATYRRTMNGLGRTVPDLAAATREDIESWWHGRDSRAVATRANELSAVKQFYRWATEWEHTAPGYDPTYRCKSPRVPRGLPRGIGREELQRLLGRLDGEMRRAVCLGAWAGLRVSEAAALRWPDVDREMMRLLVIGKGGKGRYVGLNPLLLDSLLPDTGGNVVTGRPEGYSAHALQVKVNRAIESAGVDATFHQLRHRFATVALTSGVNLLSVSRAMGHASAATTSIYAGTADSDLDLIAAAVVR